MTADNRSAHPNIPGVPWWGAVLIAVVASAAGFAVDAGSGELTAVFATLFVLGCLTAVLAVRRSGLFTAVIQPPLILFVAVPGAYFLMHQDSIEGLKDILINCGYPLIERFPLMFFTSAGVLLIGLARWYFGQSAGQSAGQSGRDDTAETSARGTAPTPGRLAAMVASLFGGQAKTAKATGKDKTAGTEAPPRRRDQDRRRAPAQRPASRTARGDRRRAQPGARRPRPDETDMAEQTATDRPRRRRQRPEDAPPPDRRRVRNASAREPRRAAPGNDRRVPYERERSDRERPPQRRSRYDRYGEGFEGYELFGGYDRDDRPGYEPRREPPPQRGNGTHHPVSRVRYRGAEDADDRVDHRRRPRETDADRWEYDI